MSGRRSNSFHSILASYLLAAGEKAKPWGGRTWWIETQLWGCLEGAALLPMGTAALTSVLAEGKAGFAPWLCLCVCSDCFITARQANLREFGSFIQTHLFWVHPRAENFDWEFCKAPFNSFNSSVNKQQPHLATAWLISFPSNPPGFILLYFLFTFSASSDIFFLFWLRQTVKNSDRIAVCVCKINTTRLEIFPSPFFD